MIDESRTENTQDGTAARGGKFLKPVRVAAEGTYVFRPRPFDTQNNVLRRLLVAEWWDEANRKFYRVPGKHERIQTVIDKIKDAGVSLTWKEAPRYEWVMLAELYSAPESGHDQDSQAGYTNLLVFSDAKGRVLKEFLESERDAEEFDPKALMKDEKHTAIKYTITGEGKNSRGSASWTRKEYVMGLPMFSIDNAYEDKYFEWDEGNSYCPDPEDADMDAVNAVCGYYISILRRHTEED